MVWQEIKNKVIVSVVTAAVIGGGALAWNSLAWASDVQRVAESVQELSKSIKDERIKSLVNQLNDLEVKAKLVGLSKYDEIQKSRIERELKLLTGAGQ